MMVNKEQQMRKKKKNDSCERKKKKIFFFFKLQRINKKLRQDRKKINMTET